MFLGCQLLFPGTSLPAPVESKRSVDSVKARDHGSSEAGPKANSNHHGPDPGLGLPPFRLHYSPLPRFPRRPRPRPRMVICRFMDKVSRAVKSSGGHHPVEDPMRQGRGEERAMLHAVGLQEQEPPLFSFGSCNGRAGGQEPEFLDCFSLPAGLSQTTFLGSDQTESLAWCCFTVSRSCAL